MARSVRRGIYHCAKAFGLFRIARRLTGKQLRILCYHGVAIGDEPDFMPMLFMSADTFRKRMELLKRLDIPVLRLDEALERLEQGTLPLCSVVITFDDGFYGNYAYTRDIFIETGFPATVYLTTYYVDHANPIFRLAVQYMFWRAGTKINDEYFDVDSRRRDGEERKQWLWRIIGHGERALDEAERVVLARQVAAATGSDYDAIAGSRTLSLMQPVELRAMEAAGVEMQLHTHRHCLPLEEAGILREVTDNRSRIEAIVSHPANHLCYPSGEWFKEQWPILSSCGILSAVTCDPGLNGPETPRLGLKRFLDSEEFSLIEVEAEICGFTELLRRGRTMLKGLLRKPA